VIEIYDEENNKVDEKNGKENTLLIF